MQKRCSERSSFAECADPLDKGARAVSHDRVCFCMSGVAGRVPGPDMKPDLKAISRAAHNDAPLILVARSVISGTLEHPSEVWLDGSFDGFLVCEALVIGKTGKFTGQLIASSVVVAGEADAEVYANQLVLKGGCRVHGEIFHEHLEIEEAAYFDGKSRRLANTKAAGLSRFDFSRAS
jgi:cytoskeletal protein CcmA (bactofilin family)